MINQYVGDPCLLNSLSMMIQEMLCQALWTEAPRDVCSPLPTGTAPDELPSSRATEGIVGSRFEECQGNPRSSGPENREQMGTVSLPGNSKSFKMEQTPGIWCDSYR